MSRFQSECPSSSSSQNIVEALFGCDVAAALGDDDAQLGLVVERLAVLDGGPPDLAKVAVQRRFCNKDAFSALGYVKQGRDFTQPRTHPWDPPVRTCVI